MNTPQTTKPGTSLSTLVVTGLITINIGLSAYQLDKIMGGENAAGDLNQAEVTRLFETLVREKPDLILQSVQEYQMLQRSGQPQAGNDPYAEEQIAVAARAKPHMEELLSTDGVPVIGNREAPVAIIEFFDYACSACKGHYRHELADFLKENPDVRLMPKYMPILGGSGRPGYDPASDMSLLAAKGAEVAFQQGKFAAYHDALLRAPLPLTADLIWSVAEQVGINMETFEADLESSSVKMAVAKHLTLGAEILGDRPATPTYIIGGKVTIGGPGASALQQMVAEVANAPKQIKP